jgi:hypothetical protein
VYWFERQANQQPVLKATQHPVIVSAGSTAPAAAVSSRSRIVMVVEKIRAPALANVFKETEIWPDLRPIREKFQRETVLGITVTTRSKLA